MAFIDRVKAFINPSEVKINPAYQGLIGYGDVPRPVTMPKNYKSYSREGYRGNDTVYKCVSYIARNGAAIPPVLYQDDTKKKKIEKHPLLDRLKNPNNEQSGVAYREAVLAYKLIDGNAYQYAIKPNKSGPPAELWSLRPDLVSIIPSKTRGIVGYQYEYIETPILPANIGHSKYFHPDNDLYGLSPLEVVAVLVDQQKAGKLWNLALLQNSARPPGAWTVPVALSKNDRERLEQRLKEKLQGYKNAGTPPVLDAGLSWQSMGLPPQVMEWLEGMQYNAAMIANIFCIPPQLIGDNSSSTYNNVQEAKAASYTEAIFPELDDLYALWNHWLIPQYPDLASSGAYLYYDKESVEVVQAVIQQQKNDQADRGGKLYTNTQCTMNESRVLAGLPEVPEGEVYKIGAILVPKDKLMDYALQSLTTPAAPPVPQAEPIAGAQPGQPGADPNQKPQKPDKPAPEDDQTAKPGKDDQQKVPTPEPGKKAAQPAYTLDVWQPPDLDKKLADLAAQGVEFLTWYNSNTPCEACEQNEGQTVALGQPFKSGHFLTPAHPHCGCQVVPTTGPQKRAREEFRQFKRGVEDALRA